MLSGSLNLCTRGCAGQIETRERMTQGVFFHLGDPCVPAFYFCYVLGRDLSQTWCGW